MISKFNSKCKRCGGEIRVGDSIDWSRGTGATHVTQAACNASVKAPSNATPISGALKPIADFLKAAQLRGLKHPKLRVLGPDGRTEVRLGITVGGVVPGSISVVLGGQFIGCVRPDGRTTGTLTGDTNLQKHLLSVAADPARAAKEFAALMGVCSFCGKPLTDEGSVECGYGPVCAKHWGLPHKALGTPSLHAVPPVSGGATTPNNGGANFIGTIRVMVHATDVNAAAEAFQKLAAEMVGVEIAEPEVDIEKEEE